MSEPETLPTGVHQEIALLPWHANGTLGVQEQQQVARHLESCLDCRRELDDLTQMKRQLNAVYGTQPEPFPRIAQSVLTRIAQDASARRTAVKHGGHWLDGLDQWFRLLFLPQWVPTLTAVILVAQLGLLLWVTMTPTQSDQVTNRSLGSATATFKVTFQEQATEGQIRSVLNIVRGRMINGPTPEGLYVVEVLAGDQTIAQKKLETLRGQTGVVRTAEAMTP